MSGGVTVRLHSNGSASCVLIFVAVVVHTGLNDAGPVALDCGRLCWVWGPYDDVGTPGQFGGVVNYELEACGVCSSSTDSLISIAPPLLASCSCVSSTIGDKVPLYCQLVELVPY